LRLTSLFASAALTAIAFEGAAGADSTPEQIEADLLKARATGAVIWAMPAVNYQLMRDTMVSAVNGAPNQIVFWSDLPTWRNQTLTPNPDAVYFMPFFDTKDVGPMVLEIPPAGEDGSITGNIDDAWQVPLEDAGPSGVDKGKGGKYLILPPGYKDAAPGGYIALPSETFGGFALIRSILKGDSADDVVKAVAYGKRVKLYPLSRAAAPPETVFLDAKDVLFDTTIPYDLTFFKALDEVVQHEPWLQRDRAMVDPLRSIGIEKGKAFQPDARMQLTLNDGAKAAHAWLDHRYDVAFPPYFEGSHWAVPASPDVIAGQSSGYTNSDAYPTDSRGLTYSFGFVGIKHLGGGQFYLITDKDKEDRTLDGGKTYRLTVPADAPVTQYWSATVYDRATHAFIREMPRFSQSSTNAGLKKNADGSVDLYLAPKAPDGQDGNWIPTKAGAEFEVMFRLYGPQKPLFDKTWKLPDLVIR
jgi:hypothetical protein